MNGLEIFDKQEAKRGWEHFQVPKYESFRQYIYDITARPSWQFTFDEVRGKLNADPTLGLCVSYTYLPIANVERFE